MKPELETSKPLRPGFRVPWPGPKPYDENHWQRFEGRGELKAQILGKLRVSKTTVLLGDSGAGKTSLIRAGVVPVLRLDRYHPSGPGNAWPVFLLREGGAKREDSIQLTWFQQLKSALQAIRKWGKTFPKAIEDADYFERILGQREDNPLKDGGFPGLIEELTQAENTLFRERFGRTPKEGECGLLIVFDQFEEQLRPGAAAQREVYRLIRDILDTTPQVKLLLSLRKEFKEDLWELENMIGELGRSTIRLPRLRSKSVVEIITTVSKLGQVAIDKDVADRIVAWVSVSNRPLGSRSLRLAEQRLMRDRYEENRNSSSSRASTEGIEESTDLLRLQAVLVELCRWALDEKRRIRLIGMKEFDKFIRDLAAGERKKRSRRGADVSELDSESETDDERLGQRVVGGTLERWIESAISGEIWDSEQDESDTDDSISAMSSPYEEFTGLGADELRLQVRRIAVRLAPLLSSADYKIAQEENALFQQALGDEIAKLGLRDPRRLSKIEIKEGKERGDLHIKWQALGELKQIGEEDMWEILSGSARNQKDGSPWTLEEAGDRILACFKEALFRLARANILRRTELSYGVNKKSYWELVHDQFGPNLIGWAEGQRGTWEDCESSLVVCRGVQPLAVMAEEVCPEEGDFYDVDSISWQGCGVQQAWGEALRFKNVRFRNCYLVGTIFDGIEFVRCTFEKCGLTGALFRNCIFKDCTFRECHSNVAIVAGTIHNLEFQGCQLNQPAIKNVTLEGRLVYSKGSKVVQGLFERIKRSPGKKANARILVEADSRAAFCFVDSDADSILKVACQESELPNRPLPDQFRTIRRS